MAKLIVVDGPDRGMEFPLSEEEGASQTVGRDPKNQVVLSDGSVSRQHIRIDYRGRDFRLVDLGSRNRTFLNGEPVREGILRSGDTIGLGDSELRFEEARELVEEPGIESTIMKELPADSGSGLNGIIDAISVPREEKYRGALESVKKLLELSRAITRSKSLDELFQDLLAILVPALEADRGVVLVLEGKRWTSRAVLADSKILQAGKDARSSGISESVVRRAAEEEKAILSAHTLRDERFQDKASILGEGIVSAIAAPIFKAMPGQERKGKGSVLGVLYADRRGPERPFDDAGLNLLVASARQAGDLAARLLEEDRLRDENRNLIRSIAETKVIVGKSKAVQNVLEFIRRAAPAHQTILIRGETGTGKELVASAIHYQSPRQGKPFVPINCAAIPETLIESELFGHEKGAFTGAVARRKGKFELAEGGTVFLDEVAELSVGCQAKILRLLEDRKFERVGGAQSVEVDVRIIAATNKELSQAISTGKFREDLFYRLNVLGITLPPLRERKEDIPLLAAHFLSEMGKGKWALAPDAMEKLLSYGWPGNIRQIRNIIESAVVLGDGPTIRAQDLVLPKEGESGVSQGETWEPLTLEELQRRHILKVLEHTGGNKKRAADILGIERCTLYAKLKTLCNMPASRAPGEPFENGEEGNGGEAQAGKERESS